MAALCTAVSPSRFLKSKYAPPLIRNMITSFALFFTAAVVRGVSIFVTN